MRPDLPSRQKILADREALDSWLSAVNRPLVFTNGCFDILHRGHVTYLEEAARLGGSLLVGINSDASVRRLQKGTNRPFNPLDSRLAVLAGLAVVDAVTAFDEETPLKLILQARPDHLVKGGDWALADIVGGEETRSWGGQVHAIPFRFQCSTTALVNRIQAS